MIEKTDVVDVIDFAKSEAKKCLAEHNTHVSTEITDEIVSILNKRIKNGRTDNGELILAAATAIGSLVSTLVVGSADAIGKNIDKDVLLTLQLAVMQYLINATAASALKMQLNSASAVKQNYDA